MKKQVTFAQNRSEHKLQRHRFSLPTVPKLVKGVDSELHRRFSTPGGDRGTLHIPRSMATAPFLKHSGLTPAQREYLYSVASTHSGERVRDIISTHYMNILHRCIRAGHAAEKDSILAPVTLPQMIEPPPTDNGPQNKGPASKHKSQGKTTLPKIHKRPPRRLKPPASKQRKKLPTQTKETKKSPSVSAPALSPNEDDGAGSDEDWLKDWLDEDDEDDEEVKASGEWRDEEPSLKDSVGLSSLSLTDWDSLSDSDS